jgi:RNA polymerase sigma factor (sigma-70 family)
MTATTAAGAAEATTTSVPRRLFPRSHADPRVAQELLAELHRHHGRKVLGLCRLLLRDPAEAEDATQQTFLSAYRSLLVGTVPEHPAAWLATIARNECWGRVQQRMRQPVPEQLLAELASTLPQPLDMAVRHGELSALFAAIGALPQPQRDALVLREFSGLSYAELADALSVSEPAVESLLVRARRELRARLQQAFAASITPLVLLRDSLSRLGEGGESSLGAAAKLGSATLAAKVAAGAATLTVIGGSVVADGRELARPSAADDRPPVRQHAASASATSGARAHAVAEPRVDHHGRHGSGSDRSGEAGGGTRGADRHGRELEDGIGASSGSGEGTSGGGSAGGPGASGPPIVDDPGTSNSGPGSGDGGQAPVPDGGASGSGSSVADGPDTSGSGGDSGSGGSSGSSGGTDSGGESQSSGSGSSGSGSSGSGETSSSGGGSDD